MVKLIEVLTGVVGTRQRLKGIREDGAQMSPFASGFQRPAGNAEYDKIKPQLDLSPQTGTNSMGGLPPGQQQPFIGRPSALPPPVTPSMPSAPMPNKPMPGPPPTAQPPIKSDDA